MTLTDVTEASLFIVLIAFLMICGTSLLLRLLKWRKGRRWRELMPHPVRFLALRLGIAFSFGILTLVLISAALTLDQNRPPDEPTPVITVSGSAGRTQVDLFLEECGKPGFGTIRVEGINAGAAGAYLESESGTSKAIKLNRNGVGRFRLSDPTTKRSLLSCYLPMPVVAGGSGSSVSLGLGASMEVDTVESAPSPSGYLDGRWNWECTNGKRCGVLATAGLAVEDGAQQVIVLVLAAVFGAIIALLIGEVLIEPIRRRLDQLKND